MIPHNIPLIGLGTWELRGAACTKIVQQALEIGYRHIDTAHVYQNHEAIAQAIKDFPRQQLFLTSKITLEQVEEHAVEASVTKACELALKELRVDYLDLYLIHSPDRAKPMHAVLKAMHRLSTQGKLLSVGVSNYTQHHLQDALQQGLSIAANQVEFHPYLYQKELLDYCHAHHIQLISYRPFGKGALISDPLLISIGTAHNKTPAQVILRWLIQKKIPTIPKASSEKHLRENLAIFDFVLNPQEVAAIDELDRGKRFCKADFTEFDY